VTTDVAQFEAAIAAASKASSAIERAQRLQDAVALYTGPLLPGFYEEWITVSRSGSPVSSSRRRDN
jgi:hypothetical protein